MKTLFLWFILLSLALLSITGCRDNKLGPPMHDGPGVPWWGGSVQIIMATDTLCFLPGDSASAQGFVVVKDDQGRAAPGIKVNLALAEPFGWIEYVDNSLRDTTGASGRVDFRFRTYNQVGPGYNTVTATVGGKQDSWTLWVQPAGTTIGSVCIRMISDEDTVYAGDSVEVQICLFDSSHTGVPGITLPLRASGGRVAPISPMDSTGCARTFWYPECCGFQCLYVQAHGIADSVCVFVVAPGRRRV